MIHSYHLVSGIITDLYIFQYIKKKTKQNLFLSLTKIGGERGMELKLCLQFQVWGKYKYNHRSTNSSWGKKKICFLKNQGSIYTYSLVASSQEIG